MTGEEPRYPVYQPSYPRGWWMRRGPYLRFAAREITSVFAAAVSGQLLEFLLMLSRGPTAYASFLRWMKLPGVIAVSAFVLVALLYHTATWFRLTTHIVVIRLGRRVVPPPLLIAGLVLAWLAASALVAYFAIWF